MVSAVLDELSSTKVRAVMARSAVLSSRCSHHHGEAQSELGLRRIKLGEMVPPSCLSYIAEWALLDKVRSGATPHQLS